MPFLRSDVKKWGKSRGWACERCGRKWSDGWLIEAHHILPQSQGGLDSEENCELLCLACHAIRHHEIARTAEISARLVEARILRTGGRWK